MAGCIDQHEPRPAWRGEAKWDGYNKVYDMKSRQVFDYAFRDRRWRLYFGSSADDKVYCLDAATGKQMVFLPRPIRLAPTVVKGASMWVPMTATPITSAVTGKLIWQTGRRKIIVSRKRPNHSRWPLRTGIVVVRKNALAPPGCFEQACSSRRSTPRPARSSGSKNRATFRKGYLLAQTSFMFRLAETIRWC